VQILAEKLSPAQQMVICDEISDDALGGMTPV
jgi:hypothetical protein